MAIGLYQHRMVEITQAVEMLVVRSGEARPARVDITDSRDAGNAASRVSA